MKERFVVIDFETTGHSVERGDRIIQIGAVVIEDHEMIERFTTFVNPEMPIPPFIENFTGIRNDMVKGAPTFSKVIPELMKLLEGSFFVAHNVHFDLTFLQNQLEQLGYERLEIPIIDTVELSRILLPNMESYKLSQLAEYLGFHHDRPHQADSDAEVTAHLLLHLMDKLVNLPLHTLKQLLKLSTFLKSNIEKLIEPIIQQKEKHIFFYDSIDLYRDLAIRKMELESEANDQECAFSFADFLETFSNVDSFLANMKDYEVREGQLQMMDQVYQSFQNHEHLLIEAGTGTGKSLGYLIPAIFYAKQHHQAVVISTHTIPLQQQLIEKSIPLIKQILPFDFQSSLLKGRNHYLCLRKFEQRMQDHFHDHYDTIIAKAQILVWLTETNAGDIEELSLLSQNQMFWYEVQSETDTCLNHHCPWFSRCFYHRAKKRAKAADVIITNHALLFTDQLEEQYIIPAYTHVVIDEAHHLEEVASNYLGTQIDYKSLTMLFARISNYFSKKNISWSDEQIEPLIVEMNIQLENVKLEMDELFSLLRTAVLKQKAMKSTEIGRISYRFETPYEEKDWQAILECCHRAVAMLSTILKMLDQMIEQIQPKNGEELDYRQKSELLFVKSFANDLKEVKEKLEILLLQYDRNYVYWIEVEEKGAKNATYIYNRPIELDDQLADEFFAKKKSVILTSATLTIKNNFSYFIERFGLADFGPKTVQISSPFQYDKQAKLLIPTDVANINDGEEQFIQDISEKIVRIAYATEGRMLVLFTSFDMLKKTYELVKEDLYNGNFCLIAQGIYSGSRNKLIKSFKVHDRAILFGTSTFWEGIDIPGDDLRCLVIVRLPFSPPDDPLLMARSEKLKEVGKNPFMDLSLPQAILRFKQGFGRLIRSSNDQGVVIVLDKRLITAKYGSLFLQSLPKVPVYKGKMDELMDEISFQQVNIKE